MNIQIFGSSKSFDSKKAERWFKERRIKYQYIDLVKKGVSPGEYRSIRAAFPINPLPLPFEQVRVSCRENLSAAAENLIRFYCSVAR